MITVKKYIKKPIEVEAVQVTDPSNVKPIVDWAHMDGVYNALASCEKGDYILKSAEGHLCLYKQSVFEKTYNEVK